MGTSIFIRVPAHGAYGRGTSRGHQGLEGQPILRLRRTALSPAPDLNGMALGTINIADWYQP
jgi:hypothetical protein